jgi:hypothetical protein
MTTDKDSASKSIPSTDSREPIGAPDALADQQSDRLVEIALRFVPSFKYVLTAGALMAIAAHVLNLLPNAAVAFVTAAGLGIFAVVFFFVDRVRTDHEIQGLLRRIVAFVFWACAVAFVALLALFLYWIVITLINALHPLHPTSKLTAEEKNVDAYIARFHAHAAKWESAQIYGKDEPDLEATAYDAGSIAEGLEVLNAGLLSYAYDFSRHKYAALANLMACNLADIAGRSKTAQTYCQQGLSAAGKAFSIADEIKRNAASISIN